MMAGRKNVRHWPREVVAGKTAWRGPTIGLRDGVHGWYDIERLLVAQLESSSRAVVGEHCVVVETALRAARRSRERDAWGKKRRLMADNWMHRPSANRARKARQCQALLICVCSWSWPGGVEGPWRSSLSSKKFRKGTHPQCCLSVTLRLRPPWKCESRDPTSLFTFTHRNYQLELPVYSCGVTVANLWWNSYVVICIFHLFRRVC